VSATRQLPSAVKLLSSSDSADPRVTNSELSSICCHGMRAKPKDKPPAKFAALATNRRTSASRSAFTTGFLLHSCRTTASGRIAPQLRLWPRVRARQAISGRPCFDTNTWLAAPKVVVMSHDQGRAQ
jgi:hypothetical protein